jgi:hypothetical protein
MPESVLVKKSIVVFLNEVEESKELDKIVKTF